MQSDYEMAGIHHERNQLPQVEEQQQQRFMVENASTSSPFFQINPSYHFPQQQPHPLLQQINHIPFTQQFFQYQHPHYRSMLDQQEISPEGVSGSYFPLSFKLGMEAANNISKASYSGYGEEGEIRGGQEDALIRGSERYCTQARQTSLAVSHCWQNQEDSAIKPPFWKPLTSAEFSNGNNNSNEREKEIIHHQQQPIIKSLEENKCRVVLFGELEAIYSDNTNADHIHRIASESVLTADDLPTNHNVSFPVLAFNDSNQASGATTAMATTAAGIDINGSESASVGGREAEAEAEATRGEVHKRKRAKDSMSRFFESLVKKLANHQEDLQRRFMETIERLDQERKEREEAWREQELAKLQKEAAARSHERSLASSREAALVSYLEKFTGQKINFQSINKEDKSCSSYAKLNNNNKRWPQAEVEALIKIRTCLESKFREPGPKGLLWEEIGNTMTSMGFQTSARRCKEKWENINKCTVKRTKEITREQYFNTGTATVDHLATVNLPEGNGDKNDKHENGSGKEDMEEVKEE